jgi:AcrR family transcriptional regulator
MTKSEIVKAAFQAWEPDMYKSMSLSVLAAHLGVSKTALYRHFANKEAIIEAMFESFFDEYFAHVEPAFEKALNEKDETKGLFVLVRGITEFYIRDKSAFIFSLCHLENPSHSMAQQMKNRNIDILKLPYFLSRERNYMILQHSISISIFYSAVFYLARIQNPTEADIQKALDRTEHQISHGFGFTQKDFDSINFDELDEIVTDSLASQSGKYNNMLKAVANAIAEAGSGDASMELVAKHAGLSKSGLYSHFKNKEDMLRQFFTIEFEKTYEDLADSPKTEKPEEQLYLMIASIIRYLQAHPEIMVALDWIRTHRIFCVELPMPPATLARFTDERFIKKVSQNDCEISLKELPEFLLFCITRLLKHNYILGKEIQFSHENIRFFYKFVISGIKGGDV